MAAVTSRRVRPRAKPRGRFCTRCYQRGAAKTTPAPIVGSEVLAVAGDEATVAKTVTEKVRRWRT
jgi:hypothetical protein